MTGNSNPSKKLFLPKPNQLNPGRFDRSVPNNQMRSIPVRALVQASESFDSIAP
jgi:hypothetical protein